MSNFIQIHLGGTDLFHADGRTDKLNTDRHTDATKPIVAFRNFAISPKSSYVILLLVVIILVLRTSLNKATPLDTNCYVSLAPCFNKLFLITFCQL